MASFPAFLKSQLLYKPKYPTHSFQGQTIIVTGANTGVGFDAAEHFVRLNAKTVIIACRNLDKGKAAKQEIEEATKRTGVVQLWELNLSSYASVQSFAKRASSLARLDVVCQNAGICQGTFELAEGHESHITVNVISQFLLALLLLPTMRKSAQTNSHTPVLSIVTSETHHWSKLPQKTEPSIFAALDDKASADMVNRYYDSKLMQILILRHLTRVVIPDRHSYPVVINCVTPGMCKTDLIRDMGIGPVIFKTLLGRAREVGSRTLVNAVGMIGKEGMGEYIIDDAISNPSPLACSEEGRVLGKRLWDELLDMLNHVVPGIEGNV